MAGASVVVAAGSLPIGAPVNAYGELARAAARAECRSWSTRVALPSRQLCAAPLALIKPNLAELPDITDVADPREAARRLSLDSGVSVAVTLGAEGMVLAVGGEVWHGSVPCAARQPDRRRRRSVGRLRSRDPGRALPGRRSCAMRLRCPGRRCWRRTPARSILRTTRSCSSGRREAREAPAMTAARTGDLCRGSPGRRGLQRDHPRARRGHPRRRRAGRSAGRAPGQRERDPLPRRRLPRCSRACAQLAATRGDRGAAPRPRHRPRAARPRGRGARGQLGDVRRSAAALRRERRADDRS